MGMSSSEMRRELIPDRKLSTTETCENSTTAADTTYTPTLTLGVDDGSGRCSMCRGEDFWTSRWGVVNCRTCHPPAPGAEAGEGGCDGNEGETA